MMMASGPLDLRPMQFEHQQRQQMRAVPKEWDFHRVDRVPKVGHSTLAVARLASFYFSRECSDATFGPYIPNM
jgi:hypothetical protein